MKASYNPILALCLHLFILGEQITLNITGQLSVNSYNSASWLSVLEFDANFILRKYKNCL